MDALLLGRERTRERASLDTPPELSHVPTFSSGKREFCGVKAPSALAVWASCARFTALFRDDARASGPASGVYHRPMSDAITVDFGKAMPLFPLPGFVLLPHAVQPLRIFEPRYRQMIGHCLELLGEGGGQIAMATFQPRHGDGQRADEPSELDSSTEQSPVQLRPAVCVGHIIQHEPLSGGRCNILLQGVCRARIMQVLEPDDDRLYHAARLAPIERDLDSPPVLPGLREQLRQLVGGPQLRRMSTAQAVLEWIDRDDIPTHAVLEIVGFALVRDEELRYRLLEEASPRGRARIIRGELTRLARLVAKADEQGWREWPKGLSWN